MCEVPLATDLTCTTIWEDVTFQRLWDWGSKWLSVLPQMTKVVQLSELELSRLFLGHFFYLVYKNTGSVFLTEIWTTCFPGLYHGQRQIPVSWGHLHMRTNAVGKRWWPWMLSNLTKPVNSSGKWCIQGELWVRSSFIKWNNGQKGEVRDRCSGGRLILTPLSRKTSTRIMGEEQSRFLAGKHLSGRRF